MTSILKTRHVLSSDELTRYFESLQDKKNLITILKHQTCIESRL